MVNKLKIVKCATPDCARTFESGSRYSVQYCPGCRAKRHRQRQRRYRKTQQANQEQLNDPEITLQRKLTRAEFSVLKDAGPEAEAFRPGSRLTRQEVGCILKFGSLAVNSILIHNPTGRLHRIKSNRAGRLVLDPPHITSNGRK